MNKREIPLEELYEYLENKRITSDLLKNSVIAIFVSLLIMFPKIYLSTKIYLTSIKLDKSIKEYFTLKAENKILSSKIERLRFYNRVEKLNFKDLK